MKVSRRFVERANAVEEGGELLGFAACRDRADLSGINGRRPPHAEALVIDAAMHSAIQSVYCMSGTAALSPLPR